MRRIIFLYLLSFSAVAAIASAAESLSGVDQQYRVGLRRLGLDRLHEFHCKRLLQRQDLSIEIQSRTTLELAAILSKRGSYSADLGIREELWAEADRKIADFQRTHQQWGGLLRLRYQWAGQLLSRARLMYDLSKVLSSDPLPAKTSLQWARLAQKTLSETIQRNEEIAESIADGNPLPKDLTEAQLFQLETVSEFRLGAAWLAMARVETDEEQRDQALSEAEQILASYVWEFMVQPITLEAHLAMAELYQLRRMPNEGIELLVRFDEHPKVPKSFASRAHLLLGQLWMDKNRAGQALEVLDVAAQDRIQGAEWPLRLFEALLRRSAEIGASDSRQASQLQARALTILDELEEKYGRYWGRRGEKVLANYGNLEQAGQDFAIVRRLANVQRSENKLTEALASYERAAEIARVIKKDYELAGEMSHAAGQVLFDLENYPACAARMLKMMSDHPEHKLQPQASLLAAYAWARQYRKTSNEQDLAKYQELLEKHLTLFSGDTQTAAEVHWLLAELAERQRDSESAIRHYQAIPPDHRRYPAGIEALAGIYHDRLLVGNSEKDSKTVQAAIDQLERNVRSPSAILTNTTEGKQSLAFSRLMFARLLFLSGVDRDEESIKILTDEVVNNPSLPANVRGQAWQSLLELHLRRGETREAKRIAESGFGGSERTLLLSLAGMEPQNRDLDENVRAAQIGVIQSAAKRLMAKPELLTGNDRLNLKLILAQSYAGEGEHEIAQSVFRKLKAQAPRDPRILISLAKSLYHDGKFAESLEIWRRILDGFPRGSKRWMWAMYYSIRCYQGLGQSDKADRYLNIVETLYPQLGGDELRPKFQKLKSDLDESIQRSAFSGQQKANS